MGVAYLWLGRQRGWSNWGRVHQNQGVLRPRGQRWSGISLVLIVIVTNIFQGVVA